MEKVIKTVPTNERIQISLEDWKKIAIDRFGTDKAHWRFKCISCGQTQTLAEFIENGVPEPDGKFYFSCIGRWVNGRGCDWTLGGVFQRHTTEVITPDGEAVPVFEFAE